MASFRPLVVALLLAGLFGVALFTFAFRLAEANDASHSLADDATISSYVGNTTVSLGNAQDVSNNATTAIGQSPITLTTASPFLTAMGSIWKTLISIPIFIFKSIVGLLLSSVLGSGYGVVIGVIGSIVLITVIFAVWQVISTGRGG